MKLPPPRKSEEQITSPSPAVSSPENTEEKKEQPAPETATAAVPAVQAAASYPVTSNTNIQINLAYTFTWSGTGTESDPFYYSTKSSSSKDTFIAQTTDEFATINGQVKLTENLQAWIRKELMSTSSMEPSNG